MESRATRGAGSSRAPPHDDVKVKHIITRKVSTDEASFKDVVLRLTGKDSAAARMDLLRGRACHGSSLTRTSAPVVASVGGSSQGNNVGVEGGGGAGFIVGASAVPFQDTVLPSLEEMDRWWGSHDSYAERP